METIMSILGELEYLKSLVKLALKKKDDSLKSSNLIKLEKMPTIHKICINKSHWNQTLHMLVEVNNHLVEGLVDTRASMSTMATRVVCELG